MTKTHDNLTSVEKGALALKSAGQVMMVYAFFLALPIGIVFAVAKGEIDQLGWILLGVTCLIIVLLIAAGILVLKRRRGGIILWWILSPLVLLQFPIGTAAGVYVIVSLCKPEVKEAMKESA